MELIASNSHPKHGQVWIGKKGRDEDFIYPGRYKMKGTTIDDLSNFLPSLTVTINFSEQDVMDFVGEITMV